MALCSSSESEVKEILDWELSLNSRDLRAHAWYHGNINRPKAESLLASNGDFLVRDCSSSGRPGDFVLSCRWDDNNLHFLIHKDIVQKDTIYEQLRYRFENECFDTVPDLITYHVGSGIAISAGSGALITNPRNRTSPLLKPEQRNPIFDGIRSDYVSLMKAASEPIPVCSVVEKVSTLERMKQKSLNLKPPAGLLEELESIPAKLNEKIAQLNLTEVDAEDSHGENDGIKIKKGSHFDLSSFESILLPTNNEDIKMDRDLIKTLATRLLETSDKAVALYLTRVDWDILTKSKGKLNCNPVLDSTEENPDPDDSENERKIDEDNNENKNEVTGEKTATNMYENLFHNSQSRWDNIIERSLTFSHFVVVTIIMSDCPEAMINKWISVAGELKSSLGNFFSFCSVMRGLFMPQITRTDGNINWMKLRQEFTAATFTFETTLRGSYQGLLRGTETYPPNTTIPELLSAALIFEDAIEMMPLSCVSGEGDQLQFYYSHLKELRLLASWPDIQRRNLERHVSETNVDLNDIVLSDMFQTEFHLILLWGKEYPEKTLKERCDQMDTLIN